MLILSRNNRSFAVIIMLGTNDCKAVSDATAEETGKGLERCLDRFESEISPEHILVIAPVTLGKDAWKPEKDPAFSRNSDRVSAELKTVYSKIAGKRAISFWQQRTMSARPVLVTNTSTRKDTVFWQIRFTES